MQSIKYCSTLTPYKNVQMYTRAMRMPELALKELMHPLLADNLQTGIIAKLADNLYYGVNSPDKILENWSSIM